MQQVAVIDDNELNLTVFRLLLAQLGNVEAHIFSDPVAGLAWCEANQPDLLIVDYMMPVLDGLTLIRRFRALPGRADVPVLMITASDEREVRYEALQNGANDYLNKPIDKLEFQARARNMLALRQSQRDLADRASWLAEEVDKATAEIRLREQELLFRLSRAAEFRDPETGAHIQRMAHYSRLIAAGLGLSAEDQTLLLQAAPMHDVGKIGIPDQILLKPGKLTPEEFAVMKGHARIGHELLRGSASAVLETGALIALHHHEKFDGTGYPSGLRGEAISLFGRIVAVADVYDALTSERPYKRAWAAADARRFLQENAGSQFDPDCVAAFLAAGPAADEIQARFRDAGEVLR